MPKTKKQQVGGLVELWSEIVSSCRWAQRFELVRGRGGVMIWSHLHLPLPQTHTHTQSNISRTSARWIPLDDLLQARAVLPEGVQRWEQMWSSSCDDSLPLRCVTPFLWEKGQGEPVLVGCTDASWWWTVASILIGVVANTHSHTLNFRQTLLLRLTHAMVDNRAERQTTTNRNVKRHEIVALRKAACFLTGFRHNQALT